MRQMGEALRKVTRHFVRVRVVFLGEQPEIVGAGADPLEYLNRASPSAVRKVVARTSVFPQYSRETWQSDLEGTMLQ